LGLEEAHPIVFQPELPWPHPKKTGTPRTRARGKGKRQGNARRRPRVTQREELKARATCADRRFEEKADSLYGKGCDRRLFLNLLISARSPWRVGMKMAMKEGGEKVINGIQGPRELVA